MIVRDTSANEFGAAEATLVPITSGATDSASTPHVIPRQTFVKRTPPFADNFVCQQPENCGSQPSILGMLHVYAIGCDHAASAAIMVMMVRNSMGVKRTCRTSAVVGSLDPSDHRDAKLLPGDPNVAVEDVLNRPRFDAVPF
ncbi:hypothetical protein [Gordonia sp. VNK21]|uniref:hypothetical protein n=1 Tax=Gordonia sp. VNK21 TaxID=3382483 RepID=UPI0038D4C86F